MDQKPSQLGPQIELVVEPNDAAKSPVNMITNTSTTIKPSKAPILTKSHGGYFRISLSLCSQALLWKILVEPNDDGHAYDVVFAWCPQQRSSCYGP